jgi:hypothetical protein
MGFSDVLQIIFLTAQRMLQKTAGFINRVFIFKSKINVLEKVWDQTNKYCHYKKRNMNIYS